MLLEDGLTRRRAERRHAAQHLVEDGGECIDVRLVGHRGLTDLLGREVLRRRLRGNDGLHRFRVAQAGELHVHQLDASVLEHHHVAGAERAVDEAHAVKDLHGSPEVERQTERGADGERFALRQDLAESATPDALHRHEGPAVLGLTERQHADQPRMGCRCLDNRVAQTHDRPRDLGRAREPAGQQPDRDPVARCRVLGGTHGPEGAGPELADDAVAALDTPADRSTVVELDDRRRRRLQSHQLRPVTFRIRPSSRYTRGTCSSLPHDGHVASPSSKHSSHATQTARPWSGIGTRERERTAALIIVVLKPLREGSTQREYQNRKRAGTSCAERLLLARPTRRAGSSARLRTTLDGWALVTIYWKSMAE